jgi:hypothetical protein
MKRRTSFDSSREYYFDLYRSWIDNDIDFADKEVERWSYVASTLSASDSERWSTFVRMMLRSAEARVDLVTAPR